MSVLQPGCVSGQLTISLLNAFGVDATRVTGMTLRMAINEVPQLTVTRLLKDEYDLAEVQDKYEIEATQIAREVVPQ